MTRGRILYVEDNVENRMLVKRILESEGYEVVEAENGSVGMDKAKAASPDLILMDINLPDIDGYDTTSRLRQIDGVGSIPIVALTANVMEGDRQKALDAGCDGYIPKPIDVDQLTSLVAAFLRKDAERKAAAPTQAKPATPAPAAAPTPAPVTAPAFAPIPVAPAAGQPKPVPPPPTLPSKPLPLPGFKIPPSIRNAPPPPPVRPPAASAAPDRPAATHAAPTAPPAPQNTPAAPDKTTPPAPAASKDGSGSAPEPARKTTPVEQGKAAPAPGS